ncbi:aminotransferase V [Oceanobacillus oncorhynchi subsp. incaldanensis]|uniref:Cysteine desulfurase n=2 Tax=Oceanobacillus TaxID=182709 RepID=A0A0A1MYA9_9BACI|nr:cysteine desulfurase family protein [Oceanobacillus oncorhynchi]MDM8100990.1 cysteine desulfurase family protein [Oceanobacillus oncorhynchi]UUI38807.1 cysteine desulfurase [Oceanobacillus oncorhynchi]GIO20797.1 aminotransferase V [Oceanobacillus oncorhynchi subsp. incaldanensis]CEI84514.1 Cysteine desulfurase [Oceanobacillus oncorhynchi]
MIYFDNSATTKPHSEVVDSFTKVSANYFANPSSIHPLGGQVEKLLEAARQQAADLIDVPRETIIFTSGGTEGNNTAIKGVALEHQSRGKHIITTGAEHPSIHDTCGSLEKLGFEITYLPVTENGTVSAADVEKAIRKDTILVTMMQVNNEIGSIQPVEEIGTVLKKYPKVLFHVDAVQGLGKVPLKLTGSGIDICTFSGHKIHGLKGTGLLYVNHTAKLYPLLHGGSQESGIRSGTENVAGAVSFVKALRLIKEKESSQKDNVLKRLHDKLINELHQMEDVEINSPEDGANHIVHFSVPGIKPEVIIHSLSQKEIYISTKSACSSRDLTESHVLVACGKPNEVASSGLRVSFSYENTEAEAAIFVEELKKAIQQFKEVLR